MMLINDFICHVNPEAEAPPVVLLIFCLKWSNLTRLVLIKIPCEKTIVRFYKSFRQQRRLFKKMNIKICQCPLLTDCEYKI